MWGCQQEIHAKFKIMSLRKNVALRTAQADAFAGLWDGGTIQIRTGGQPADPASAASGTLLATISLPTPAFGAAAAGVVSKTGTWTGTAVATNTAGWARFISADSLKTFDVSISEGSPTDLEIDDDAIVTGNVVTVTTFTFTVPSGV